MPINFKDIKVIKESCGNKRVIRTNTYGSHLDLLLALVEIARYDFPGIDDDKIEIVKFGGRRYKRTMGIIIETDINHEEYKAIHEMEYIL